MKQKKDDEINSSAKSAIAQRLNATIERVNR
jgi:hypothetical protein